MAAGVASPSQGPTLWGSILQSASSSRATPTKGCLVLGDAQSGKSTLIAALRGSPERQPDDGSDADLALSYASTEVRDDEDIAARLSLFRLASSPAYASLIPFALNADTFQRSVVAITLDWKKPWTWVESLERWLAILEQEVKKIAAQNPSVVEQGREDVENFIRGYSEPAKQTAEGTGEDALPNGSESVPTPSASKLGVSIPLPEGCLTSNLGIPIIVVCSKADATKTLEREHDMKEQQFDFIQQTLRTICLKYGASLFYVSSTRPVSYTLLRSYTLHRTLLLQPQSPLSSRLASKHAQQIRPQVVDRDTVLVPAGWDSWGKIAVLNETFDCRGVAGVSWSELKGVYGQSVREKKGVESALMVKTTITAEDDQVFLQRHLNGAPLSSMLPPPKPLNTTSSNQDLDDIAAKLARLSAGRRPPVDGPRDRPPSTGPNSSASAAASTAASGAGGSQNEVIANFFDSLLKKGPQARSTPSPSME